MLRSVRKRRAGSLPCALAEMTRVVRASDSDEEEGETFFDLKTDLTSEQPSRSISAIKVVVSIRFPVPGKDNAIRRLTLKNFYSCSETADAIILKFSLRPSTLFLSIQNSFIRACMKVTDPNFNMSQICGTVSTAAM